VDNLIEKIQPLVEEITFKKVKIDEALYNTLAKKD
jgi:hypothetical protein